MKFPPDLPTNEFIGPRSRSIHPSKTKIPGGAHENKRIRILTLLFGEAATFQVRYTLNFQQQTSFQLVWSWNDQSLIVDIVDDPVTQAAPPKEKHGSFAESLENWEVILFIWNFSDESPRLMEKTPLGCSTQTTCVLTPFGPEFATSLGGCPFG